MGLILWRISNQRLAFSLLLASIIPPFSKFLIFGVMRSFLAVILCAFLLLGSTGFHVSMHLCGGQLKDIAFFGEAEPCSHADPRNEELPPCHAHLAAEAEEEKPCCQDRKIEIETVDEDYLNSSFTQYTTGLYVIAAPPTRDIQSPSSADILHPDYLFYKPPLLFRDIPVQKQSFLI